MAGKQRVLKLQEQRMKRELEDLRRKSQHDSLLMKQLIGQSRRNTTALTTPPSLPGSPHALDLPRLSPSGRGTRSPPVSAEIASLAELHAELLQSPPASHLQTVLPPDVVARHSRVSQGQSPSRKTLCDEREPKSAGAPAKASPKPVIAQLAGTTRAVCMSKRPQPPAKPRSERPLTGDRSGKFRAAAQQVPGAEKKGGDGTRARRALSSDSTGESGNDEESCCSDQSNGGARGKLRRTKRRKRRRAEDARQRPASSDQRGSKTLGGGADVVARAPRSVKSAAELLEEARGIAGVEGPADQQRAPDEAAAAAKTLVREGGRTVDEIIASLQGGGSDALSASDQMIEELMERVLGDSYHADNEEEPTLETEDQEGTNEQSAVLPVQPAVSSQKEVRSPQPLVWIPTGRTPSRPTRHPDVPSGVYKLARPVSPLDSELNLEGDVTNALDPTSKVTRADIMVVRGDALTPLQRARRESQQYNAIQGLSLFATWAPKTNATEYKTIHHLCTSPLSRVLPVELQLASRACHVPSQLAAAPQFHQQRAALRHIAAQADRHRIACDGVPPVAVSESHQDDGATHLPAQASDTLADWQRIAEHYVEKPRIGLHGRAITMCSSELRMFWNPAPPKFSCTPSFVKDKLFPKYQATRHNLSSEELLGELQEMVESACDVTETEPSSSVENVLSRKYKSMEDLRPEETIPQPSLRNSSEDQTARPRSAPHLSGDAEAALKVPSDFATITRELEAVRRQRLAACVPAKDAAAEPSPPAGQPQEPRSGGDSAEDLLPALSPSLVFLRRERGRAGPGEKPGRRISVSSSKRSRGGGKKISAAKLAYIYAKLQKPPRTLLRSESLGQLSQKPRGSPETAGLPRGPSLPLLLDFESFAAARGGIPDALPPREWARDIWDAWFDELFPPLEESAAAEDDPSKAPAAPPGEPPDKPPALDECRALDGVDLSQTLGEALTSADLEAEVARLTQALGEPGRDRAFDTCRRGALYKKLGQLNRALEDLNAVISLEPYLLDAYWHRHGIYLLRNDPTSALDDLNFIIKHNKKHGDAFKSRAEIYRARGETTLAIINYTQAIKCRPSDDENHFRRAEMYKKRSEILLAMEDYAKTFTVNPARTDALMIHGLHYFHSGNWMVALGDFTLLVQQEPGHAMARTYRGRILAKLGQFQEAIEDFSLAVHLDPNDWLAFYHRGCLLRKRMPELALRDLSTSVLINDSSENLRALLHRGLLYTEQRQWQQAVSDFDAVIKLDRTVAVAHVNLGLIYMLKMDHNYDAIKMFSNALRVDPTYIRGYVCRAQAYRNVNDLKRALKDLTRAIHMKPDAQHLYIMRGQYLCDMEQFDLATFSIQYAAEMNKALGSSPIQQAAVQSFLGNDTKAIACLVAATNTRPYPHILILLGKTQMKARRFREAVESFRKALALLSPNEPNLCSVPEAAEVFYHTGMCCMAQDLLLQALEAFSNAVKINPDYADAYHQRGLCRMSLQQSKSVQDFNRALSINPNLFQVYLSRAAFYGANGHFTKAILNCNEAIKIQPKSIRAYLYRGALKFYLKAYKLAVEDLTRAIRIDNTCSFAYYNRGVCYQHLKEYEWALRDYGIVLLLPNQKEIDLKVLINRGLLYVELNDHHNALQDFKAASMRSPEDATIYHALGVYHHRLSQLQESVEAYSESMRRCPFFLDAYVGRGNVFMDYGHAQANKQAQRDFLSALHLDPLCSNARISLAYNFQVFGCFQRAWNQFTVAVEVNPECWPALEGRAVINLQMGNTYAAFQDINNALKHNPLSDQLLTNRGVINQFMGDKASAMKDYQRAISVNPKYALAFFNAANLLFYNRQFEQASEYYSRALELQPGDESAVLNRAITLALLRRIPEALRHFSEALRLSPYSSHVFFNRASLYCSLGRYRAAERDLTRALGLQPSDALVYKLRADVRGHLGLTELAVQDYRAAVELQEMGECGPPEHQHTSS